MKREGPLREGFTTGTAAAGAAKAATLLLLGGQPPQQVDVPLPGGGRMQGLADKLGFSVVRNYDDEVAEMRLPLNEP